MTSLVQRGLLPLVALLITGLSATDVGAQPQLPNYAPVVTGRITVAATDALTAAAPIEGADVEVFLKNASVLQTQTDARGDFRLDRLPVAASERDGFVVVARPSARDAGLAPVATAFVLVQDGPVPTLQLTMQTAASRPIRVVKFADGAPLEGATVRATGFAVGLPQGRGNWRAPIGGVPPARTDADGTVVLKGLPTGVLVELTAQHEEYADTVVRFLRSETSKTIPLALESAVFGQVLLGDEPLGVPQWTVKLQGWDEPWRQNWRLGPLNARGEYVIENVTVPAIIEHPTYPINLELNRIFDPQPGLHAAYARPTAAGT